MSVEHSLADLPHCEFLRAWDKDETNPYRIVWESFCGGRPETLLGPEPCLYPGGVSGWEDCPGCVRLREKIKELKEKGQNQEQESAT